MANYNKSFNFRNGVQVDDDNFIVNANGLVGIGTSIPREFLDVHGTAKVTGLVTARNLAITGVSTFYSDVKVGSGITLYAATGIISATAFYGDASNMTGVQQVAVEGWIVNAGNISTTSKVGIGTTLPYYSLQVGQDPLTGNGLSVDAITGNVNATGILTAPSFVGNITGNVTGDITGDINSTGVSTFATLKVGTGITINSGIVTATTFVGNVTGNINSTGVSTFATLKVGTGVTISGGIVTATSFSGSLTGNVTGNVTGTATTATTLASTGSISITSVNSGFTSTGIATVTDTLYVTGFPAKIGVGTTTAPEADIEVNKTGISSIRVISSNNNIASIGIGRSAEIRTGNTNTFYSYSTRNSLDIINSNAENVNYYLDYGSAGVGTGNFNWIYGQSPSSPLMSLTYGGNLGLGITNPPSKLYVAGTSYITGITTIDNDLRVNNDFYVTGNVTFNGSITGNLGITTLSRLGISTSTISNNSYEFFVGGDPVFGEGVSITKTSIRASGNIQSTNITSTNINSTGIITSPSFVGALTGNVTGNVTGTASTAFSLDGSPNIIVSSVGIGTTTITDTNTKLYVNGNSEFNGNVGIGTTLATAKLHIVGSGSTALLVNGDARITGILTIGTSSITLNGDTNTLTVPNLVVTNNTTGVIASGVAITVRDGGGDLGNASIIDFGNNLSVTFASGIATITGASGGGGESYWASTAAGIHTLSNVGVGTTNPQTKLQVGGVLGFGTFIAYGNTVTNIRIGDNSTGGNGNGHNNISMGIGAGSSIGIYGSDNNFFGYKAGYYNTDGALNNFFGYKAGYINTTGGGNNFIGERSGYYNTTGQYNNFFGTQAGYHNTIGQFNNFTGYFAGYYNTTGNQNVFLGSYTGISTSASNKVIIGSGIYYPFIFDAPDTTKDNQFAVGVNTTGTSEYWLVGNESFNIGIGTTNPQYKLDVGGDINFTGTLNQNNAPFVASRWSAGTGDNIYRLNGNVGVGTTNPTSALTVKGNTSLETLNVSGVSTFNEKVKILSNLEVGEQLDALSIGLKIWNGNAADSYLELFGGSNEAYIRNTGTTASGININATGSVALGGGGSGGWSILANSDGSASLALNVIEKLRTIGAGVTVTGTTFTNNLSVSGVSTLTSNVSVGGTISIDGGLKLVTNNATIVGTSGTVGEIKRIGGAPFFYDGSAWREFVLSSGTPVSVPADTEWDNVILRSTYDTASPDFFDFKFSEQPILTGTGATTVASPVKIGTKSFRNNGAPGAGISYAYRAEHNFTGPWTIEFWINHDGRPFGSVAYPEAMVSQISLSDNNNWSFGLRDGGSSNIVFSWNNEAKVAEQVLHNVSYSTFDNNFIAQWRHYALVRQSNNGSLHFYIDGYEVGITTNNSIIDNDITSTNGAGLHIGGTFIDTINGIVYGNQTSIDAHFDDLRITTDERYVSVGNTTTQVFVPSTTALPTTGTLSSYVQPPGDKYGEIVLGGSPTWRGTSGVTVSQQSSGNYRVSFASTCTNANDYFVLTQAMDQGFASYVGVARSTTHVDFAINKESDNAAVNTGSLSVQIKNHI